MIYSTYIGIAHLTIGYVSLPKIHDFEMYVANRPNIASGGSAMLIRKSIKHYDVGVCSTSSGRSKGFGAIDPTSRYTSEFVFRLFIVISNVDVYFHHYFFRLFGTEQMTIIME